MLRDWRWGYDRRMWMFNWQGPKYQFISATSELLAEQNLVEALLSNYSIYARPVKDPSQALLVSIDVLLKQIVDVVSPTKHYQPLQWRHNYEHDGVLNHRRFNCLFNRLFRRRSKRTLKLHITGPCEGNSSVTCEFPAQRASNKVSIWWRHHVTGSHLIEIFRWLFA